MLPVAAEHGRGRGRAGVAPGATVQFVAVTALAVIALLAALAAPSLAATLRRGPAGNAFYRPPAKLVPGRAGSVVWARTLTGRSALAEASRTVLVLYRSISPAGRPVVVSGIVATPRGRPPAGGWPVIAWNHGATGVADRCAPSKTFASSNDRTFFQATLPSGYAVVATDYAGLGTAGLHPYMIGVSEGRSVVDNVKAARAVDGKIGKRWLPIGVSQGGHATLWAAGVASKWGRGLRLVGAAALAPASHHSLFLRVLRGGTTPTPALGAAALTVAGTGTAGMNVPSLLTATGRSLFRQLDSKCFTELAGTNSFGGVAPPDVLRTDPGADPAFNRLYQILDANEPGALHLRVPIFLGQGTQDTSVLPVITEDLVDQLRKNGASVDYRSYPATHGAPEVLAAGPDLAAFAAQRFGRNP